jgi:hypothetical protein
MHIPILKQSPFLNELSWKAGDGPDFFIFSSSFRIYLIWFIYMQQETRNRVGSCPTVKYAERISPRSELLRCIPHLDAVPIFQQIELEGWGWARSLSFLVLPESTLFGSFICNRRLAITLEVAQP